jgi:hypothetical protein
MICEIDIPWTPRTIKKSTEPKSPVISFETLLAIIMDALKPFDEARVALSNALINYKSSEQAPAPLPA